MSNWSHIVACIHLETDIPQNTFEYYKNKILNESPRITGSEGNADIFVNQPSGYTSYLNCDCSNCKYGDTAVYENGYLYCDSKVGYMCPSGEYQTRIIITIVGDLRDRYKEQTEKEYDCFKNWLTTNINGYIIQITCRVE